MAKQERMLKRNEAVRKLFYKLLSEKPKYKVSAIVEEVAEKFFLSTRTIDAIIGYEGIYADNVKKQGNQQLTLL